MLRVAFLVSGAGHLVRRVLETLADDARIRFAGVLGDGGGLMAVERAREAGIPVAEVQRRGADDLARFNGELFTVLEPWEPDLIVCAFDHLVTVPVLERWRHRLINVHYSLLPAFAGFRAIPKAIRYGARFAGTTVHLVDDSVDLGAPILQGIAPVDPDEDEAAVHRKLFDLALTMTVQALDWWADGRVRIETEVDRTRVRIEGGRYDGFPINPAPDPWRTCWRSPS
jgi:phosphoribosylglycinamide formyltransferase-1